MNENIILTMYELADIYKYSVRYFQKQLKKFMANAQRTGQIVQRTKKDNRTALQGSDLQAFIKYLKLDKKELNEYTANVQRTTNEQKTNTKRTENEQANSQRTHNEQKTIKFLMQQLEAKDKQIKQQNTIIAMTQQNLNNIITKHNELENKYMKKAELIEKQEEEHKQIEKLKGKIDKAILQKKAIDDETRVKKEFMEMRKMGLMK